VAVVLIAVRGKGREESRAWVGVYSLPWRFRDAATECGGVLKECLDVERKVDGTSQGMGGRDG
jgi:hypothetical protein